MDHLNIQNDDINYLIQAVDQASTVILNWYGDDT